MATPRESGRACLFRRFTAEINGNGSLMNTFSLLINKKNFKERASESWNVWLRSHTCRARLSVVKTKLHATRDELSTKLLEGFQEGC